MPIYGFDHRMQSRVVDDLIARGFEVCVLVGSAAHDKLAFFHAALAGWPLGDATHTKEASWCAPENWMWDAFVDFLWQGLTEYAEVPIVLVWTSAEVLLNANPSTYARVMECIDAVDKSLATTNSTIKQEHNKGVVVLVGNVPGLQQFNEL